MNDPTVVGQHRLQSRPKFRTLKWVKHLTVPDTRDVQNGSLWSSCREDPREDYNNWGWVFTVFSHFWPWRCVDNSTIYPFTLSSFLKSDYRLNESAHLLSLTQLEQENPDLSCLKVQFLLDSNSVPFRMVYLSPPGNFFNFDLVLWRLFSLSAY